jgi:hypothetical protein
MRSLTRSAIGVLFLVALSPLPGGAAEARHPLDPAAPAGVMPTRNFFENAVPLLSRENPQPSFAGEGAQTTGAPAEAPLAQENEPMGHGGTDHGAPQAEAE